MKTKVIIEKWNGEIKEKTFATEKQAKQFFLEFCDEHNIPPDHDNLEAGGVGFDFCITVTEE